MNHFFDVGDVQVFRNVVTAGDLAVFGGEIVHPVCATFALARDIEWTSRQFVLKLRDDDEEGIRIHRSQASRQHTGRQSPRHSPPPDRRSRCNRDDSSPPCGLPHSLVLAALPLAMARGNPSRSVRASSSHPVRRPSRRARPRSTWRPIVAAALRTRRRSAPRSRLCRCPTRRPDRIVGPQRSATHR